MSSPTRNNWPGLTTIEARESALLAPFALHSSKSKGRKYPESPHPYRGPFQRDRDRIIHTAAYRRLGHKTQVFTGELGDYHRTRLTHTLEVASIARTVGRALRINEDLVEALALMHDIGHPPFGHAGEDTLNELLVDEGGFSHNRHALRIVEELETRYQNFPGLNLSYEVLESQRARVLKDAAPNSPFLEAQVVDAADSAAYDSHDADDALQLGLLNLDDLLQVPFWREAAQRVRGRATDLDSGELRRAVIHELIDWQVSDLLEVTSNRLVQASPSDSDQVRQIPLLVAHGMEMEQLKAELESFLFERVYRHPEVLRVRKESQDQLTDMFQYYLEHEGVLPPNFRARIPDDGLNRTIGDYLAGMTDRFARREHERLCGVYKS